MRSNSWTRKVIRESVSILEDVHLRIADDIIYQHLMLLASVYGDEWVFPTLLISLHSSRLS